MYKNLTIVILLFLVTISRAQNIKLNINPFHISQFMPRLAGVDFEKSLNFKNSLGVTLQYYYREPSHSGDGEYSGLRIRYYYRQYFLNEKKYNGFFISPTISHLHTSVPNIDEPLPGKHQISGRQNGFGFGLVSGYQISLENNLALGFSLGANYYINYVFKEFADLSSTQFWNKKIEFDFELSIGLVIN